MQLLLGRTFINITRISDVLTLQYAFFFQSTQMYFPVIFQNII